MYVSQTIPRLSRLGGLALELHLRLLVLLISFCRLLCTGPPMHRTIRQASRSQGYCKHAKELVPRGLRLQNSWFGLCNK